MSKVMIGFAVVAGVVAIGAMGDAIAPDRHQPTPAAIEQRAAAERAATERAAAERQARDALRTACAPVGNLAAHAWELSQRGIPLQTAIRAATSQVTDRAMLPRIRALVEIGYETRTEQGARDRAVSRCMTGEFAR